MHHTRTACLLRSCSMLHQPIATAIYTAPHCNCNTLHQTTLCACRAAGIWYSNTPQLQHAATRCNTIQHAATRCNPLQHAATHYNTLHHALAAQLKDAAATHCICNSPQHTATHCNTLHHTAPHYNTHAPCVCRTVTEQCGAAQR